MCSFSKFYREAEKLQAALCSGIRRNDPMKAIRVLLAAVLLAPLFPAHAAGEESPALGHALALIHVFVRIAAQSETEQQSAQALDDVLAGRNAAANEAAAGLAREVLADVPPEHRATLYAIGRDLAAVARKNLKDPRNRPAER
jgi:hypothetical protein